MLLQTAVTLTIVLAVGGAGESHPLVPVALRILDGSAGPQPAWKLPLVLRGLLKEPKRAKCTCYCEESADGGGPITAWGTPIRWGIVAADPRYWGPGRVIYIGPPVDNVVIVEDTGGAIKGPHRFDVCVAGQPELCQKWGVFRPVYVELHRVKPRRRWGRKPPGWHPPVLPITEQLVAWCSQRAPVLKPHLDGLLDRLRAQAPGQGPG